jgi:hypothetical protein
MTAIHKTETWLTYNAELKQKIQENGTLPGKKSSTQMLHNCKPRYFKMLNTPAWKA